MFKINRTIALILDGLIAARYTDIALVFAFAVVTCQRTVYLAHYTNLGSSVIFSAISLMCHTVVASG